MGKDDIGQSPYIIFSGTLEYEVGLFCSSSLLSIEEVKAVWMKLFFLSHALHSELKQSRMKPERG